MHQNVAPSQPPGVGVTPRGGYRAPMAAAAAHTYRYPFASRVEAPAARVATALEGTADDLFFEGRPRSPAAMARALLVVASVVRARFFRPMSEAPRDPVVTSGGDRLRWEGFSGCNGAYARLDLDAAALDCDLRGRGTTNVDFNPPMLTALSRVRDADGLAFRVGGRGVEVEAGGGAIVERKVALPARWLKGFCEVQAVQPRLAEVVTLSPREAETLFREAPKGRETFLTRRGRSWRWGRRGEVRVGGAERLAALAPVLRDASSVAVSADDSGATAWRAETDFGRLTLVLSPATDRGFSGEGQALSKLAGPVDEAAVEAVARSLRWSGGVDVGEVVREAALGEAALSEGAVESALAVLGSRGVAGCDAAEGRYFHRVLPFDRGRVGANQPRLKSAQSLASEVTILKRDGASVDASVPGSGGASYLVRLRPEGDRCNCPWGVRHAGERGPCKHALAVRLAVGS